MRCSTAPPTSRPRRATKSSRRSTPASRGRGPRSFTDFDEYSLYVLRDLDVGGPDFVYPPPALAAAAGGYGHPVELDRVPPPRARRLPADRHAARPLRRRARRRPTSSPGRAPTTRCGAGVPGAQPALVHRALGGRPAAQCAQIATLAAAAPAAGSHRPADDRGRAWHPRSCPSTSRACAGLRAGRACTTGLVMKRAGTLRARVRVPHSGVWEVWVKGQIMPTATLRIDGRPLARSPASSTATRSCPMPRRRRACGSPPASTLSRSPAAAPRSRRAAAERPAWPPSSSRPPARRGAAPLHAVPAAAWRTLCGGRYEWVELLAL